MTSRRRPRIRALSVAVAAIGLLAFGPVSTASAAPPAAAPATMTAAPGETPFDLPTQITDRADVLQDPDGLQSQLDQLAQDEGIQLFAVFVDSFDGQSPQEWTQATYEASGMGSNDVLLAVAVQDRRYGMWTTQASGLEPSEVSQVQTEFVEPALAQDDWDGAVSAAAEGLGEGGGSSVSSIVFLVLGAVGVIAIIIVILRSRGGAKDGATGEVDQPVMAGVSTDQLRQNVSSALVDLDNAIRSSTDELAFAEAQFGQQATQQFTAALESARAKADDAFRIQQEIDITRGAGRLQEADERARLAQILDLTTAADEELDAQESEFARLRDLQATVPQFLTSLRTRISEVTDRIPVAQQELAGLAATHPRESLTTLRESLDRAQAHRLRRRVRHHGRGPRQRRRPLVRGRGGPRRRGCPGAGQLPPGVHPLRPGHARRCRLRPGRGACLDQFRPRGREAVAGQRPGHRRSRGRGRAGCPRRDHGARRRRRARRTGRP